MRTAVRDPARFAPLTMPWGCYPIVRTSKRLDENQVQVGVWLDVTLNQCNVMNMEKSRLYYELSTGRDRVTGQLWSDFQPNIIGVFSFIQPQLTTSGYFTSRSADFPKSYFNGRRHPQLLTGNFWRVSEIDAIGFAESEKPFVAYLKAEDRTGHLEQSRMDYPRPKQYPRDV